VVSVFLPACVVGQAFAAVVLTSHRERNSHHAEGANTALDKEVSFIIGRNFQKVV
jgi:hypothetical protein